MYAGIGEEGRDMGGLSAYLFGPGVKNEHTNPHVVASSQNDIYVHAYSSDVSASDARQLGNALEANFREHIHSRERQLAAAGEGQRGGMTGHDRNTNVQPHVFHAYLSLKAEDGQLSDEQWNELAHDYMGEMFGDEVEKMDWMAVRHGLSEAGNDHIHLAVNLVTNDGQYANTYRSKIRSRDAARELEKRHTYLRPMNVHEGDRAAGNYHRVEREKNPTATRGRLPSSHLSRIVRSAAMNSRHESEFLAQLNEKGVMFIPRWKAGGYDKVVGYAVKLQSDKEGVWRGGGKLARDLTITKLRERWDQTSQDEVDALKYWGKEKLPRRRNLEAADADRAVKDAVRFVYAWQKEIGEISHADMVGWKREAGRLSGVFGELGQRYKGQLGADMRWFARRYERMAQHDDSPVYRGKGNAERASQQIDIALMAPSVISPGSNAALLASIVQTQQIVERANRARAEADEWRARGQAALDSIADIGERRGRIIQRMREFENYVPEPQPDYRGRMYPPHAIPDMGRGGGHDYGLG